MHRAVLLLSALALSTVSCGQQHGPGGSSGSCTGRTLTLSASSAPAGGRVTVSGTGFVECHDTVVNGTVVPSRPETDVVVHFEQGGRSAELAEADATAGSALGPLDVTVPDWAVPGPATVCTTVSGGVPLLVTDG